MPKLLTKGNWVLYEFTDTSLMKAYPDKECWRAFLQDTKAGFSTNYVCFEDKATCDYDALMEKMKGFIKYPK